MMRVLLLQVLGKNHVIKSLEKCDFTPIYDHLMAERDKKKALTKEVRSSSSRSQLQHQQQHQQ
jgi:DNA topoisomerase-1